MSALAARTILQTPRSGVVSRGIATEVWALIEAAYLSDGTGMYAAAVSLSSLLDAADAAEEAGDDRAEAVSSLREDIADNTSSLDDWTEAARDVMEALGGDPGTYTHTDGDDFSRDAVVLIEALQAEVSDLREEEEQEEQEEPVEEETAALPELAESARCATTGMSAKDAVAWVADASRDAAHAVYALDGRGTVHKAAKMRLWDLKYGEDPGWPILCLSGRGKARGTACGEIALMDDSLLLLAMAGVERDTRDRKGVLAMIEQTIEALG